MVNAANAYSTWPTDRETPGGWTATGFYGTRDECLDHIEAVWAEPCVPDVADEEPVSTGTDAAAMSARAGHRLDRLLIDAARVHGDREALVLGETTLTYAELFGRACALAASLRDRGAGADIFVGVGVDRSVDSVVGVLGVILSGAAYLPLDVAAPVRRLREMVLQAGVETVTGVLPADLAAELDLARVPVPVAASPSSLKDAPARSPASAVWVLFTSGSTGRPKAVVVCHRAAVHSTAARFSAYPSQPLTYLMSAPLTVDAAMAGLSFALAAGGRLVVPTAEQAHDPGLLGELVLRHEVTHLDLIPSEYAILLEYYAADLGGLSCVILGGEPLSQGVVRDHAAVLPEVALFNEYGPTESAVWCTTHPCDPADDGPLAPIGLPIDGLEVKVVDASLELVPPGTVGEIGIAGPQLARGYLGQPRATASRFMPHPTVLGERFYLTGDLGHVDDRGNLVYCGRIDSMVKVRGFRVELEEIEGWLRTQPDVVDAVVVPEEFAGSVRLAAAIVEPATFPPSLAPLATRLAEFLPAYMIPSTWTAVEELPRRVDGKIDRSAASNLVLRDREASRT